MLSKEIRARMIPANYSQSSVLTDEEMGTAIFTMEPSPRPCFTSKLLYDMRSFQKDVTHTIEADITDSGHSPIKFIVLASGIQNYFNLGGDLDYFIELITRQDRHGLLNYATICIDIVYEFSINLNLPVTSVALVQGSSQGGGFEVALSCNVLIAERGSKFGFPEVLFNLFPGMGAYTFLSRRINKGLAERMILSGNLYTAEHLYDIGVVDILADKGEGMKKLYEYTKSSKRTNNARQFIDFTRNQNNRNNYDELMEITRFWVDAALRLNTAELRTMRRLVRAQNQRVGAIVSENNTVAVKYSGI